MAIHAYTFSDWISAAFSRGISLDLVVKREEDYKRLAECGLPTFEYRRFDGEDVERMLEFKRKYELIVAILYPKSRSDRQPWQHCRSEKELMAFLKANEPLSRYIVRLGQNKEPQRGGTIISYDSRVICELGEGNQAELAHDLSKNIWRAESKFGMPFRYSSNCTEDVKRDIWHALEHIRFGRDFMEGYFEFFVCDKSIHFIDYKTDPRFYRPKEIGN